MAVVSLNELMNLAREGKLPPDFDLWGAPTKDGRTVAHRAALYGHLPADFNQWGLTDNNGDTVAHQAARRGHLPDDFDQWDLTDSTGTTVAHMAAVHGHLPANFDRWDIGGAWSVAHQVAKRTQRDDAWVQARLAECAAKQLHEGSALDRLAGQDRQATRRRDLSL